jgi:hypothetical protein
MTPTLQTALSLRADGVACIPVHWPTDDPDKEKVPRVKSWRQYMQTLPTEKEQSKWFDGSAGIALVAGAVQCIDVDEKYQKGLMAEFRARALAMGLGPVWDRCLIQRTPSGGYHLVFRSEGAPVRNMKLAQKDAKNGYETLIETRGAGGYFLIDPSKGYEVISGNFGALPVLSEDDRADLIDVARSFNKNIPEDVVASLRDVTRGGDFSPGDDYDQRGDLPELLRSHGWTQVDSTHWRRPGKARGISASLGHIPGRFWVFSSSTEFEPEKPYKPYAVYAMLEHGGDYKAAAQALARQGYGSVKQKKSDVADPRASLAKALEVIQEQGTASPADDMLQRALASRFRADENPQCGRTLLMLGNTVVGTAGNIVAISAQAKAGKTALYSGAIAAALRAGIFLHCSSPDQTGAVIHIDTEQSHYDAHRLSKTVLWRAGIRGDDPRYMAFRWRDFPVAIRRQALAAVCAEAIRIHGWIHSIWIDGVADFVHSVNDEQECGELITGLMAMSSEYDCMICCVIHLNPTSDAKSRGHLGSALERKAEANIRLNKNDDMVTEVWGEKMRGKPIMKKDALCFAWNEQAGRHEAIEGGKGNAEKSRIFSREEREAMASMEVRNWIAGRAWRIAEINQMIQSRYRLGKNSWAAIIKQAEALTDGTIRDRIRFAKSYIDLIGPADEVAREKLKIEREFEQKKQMEIPK